MKTLILFILTAILFVSCSPSKRMMESPDSPVVTATNDSTFSQPDDGEVLTYHESEIRVGSMMVESSHNMYSESTLKIIKVNNSTISAKSTNMGHVVYKIPSEMSVRNTYQVIVRISKSTVSIFENLNGEVRTSSVPITETMEVKLIDPSPDDRKMFDIIADNGSIQLVENDEAITQWTWNITPIRSGSTQLKIVIAIITNGNKKETVYEDTVRVKNDLGKQIPFFFSKYWQWMLTTLVIPFGVWFYNRKKKKEEPKKNIAKRK